MNNITILIFGMSGDLAKRKLIPALYDLMLHEQAKNFVIIGVGLETVSCDDILKQSQPYIKGCDEQLWCYFCGHCRYHAMDVTDTVAFTQLTQLVVDLEKEYHVPGNRLLYCATVADFFCTITEQSVKTKLMSKLQPGDTTWSRIVFEKPFGNDEQSAHTINQCIGQHLAEEQLYRIDHYLTEEMVSNIALVRFANCIFEPLWHRDYIEKVHITLDEELCLEGRGVLYDKQGALRDMIQNHALELLALVSMEPPDCLTGECIRQDRASVLKQIEVVDALLGQYEGYRNEPGVDRQSTTETFAVVKLIINNDRWRGVPFYLKTGKCLAKKESSIRLIFKKRGCPFMKDEQAVNNELTIELAPDQSFSVRLNVKKPGTKQELVPVTMNYCQSCLFHEVREAYEILIKAVINGEHSVSVRFDEIEYAWHVIDSIKKMNLPLHTYKKGGNGPEAQRLFVLKK